MRTAYKSLDGKSEKKRPLGSVGADERIILEIILKK
jgi:hypothetical protein